MSAVDHEAAVAKLLADLGDTADAVADRLRALGIKGLRKEACDCPIARLLTANGYDAVAVSQANYGMNSPRSERFASIEGDTPTPVAEFICRFDAGVYLDLVEVEG